MQTQSLVPQHFLNPSLVIEGEERGRRGNKIPVMFSHIWIQFDNEGDLQACIKTLRESDEHLKARPENMKMWDWQSTVRVGMTIEFGVAWYDRGFFHAKKDVYTDGMHLRQYMRFGKTPADLRVVHYKPGDKVPGKTIMS